MTTTKPLADDLSVCSFVSPQDLPQLAGAFRTIVNARPDAEEPGQPSSAEIEATARRLGLEYVHIPVVPGQITDDQVAAFAKALSDKPGPVLAYCKSGTRAASLWALSRAGEHGAEQVLAAAAKAGFDLEALRPRLEAKAGA
jgi:sulfide:quinone oxidoreductase|uniref:TIGR01244 family sulfur transferase n=1 Tax=Altererythrobacter segetis TaxID=1104773 RepID=UPI0014083A57|nr:TIGR01244 family sulfur transferase [Altererythrobacter segetis]